MYNRKGMILLSIVWLILGIGTLLFLITTQSAWLVAFAAWAGGVVTSLLATDIIRSFRPAEKTEYTVVLDDQRQQ